MDELLAGAFTEQALLDAWSEVRDAALADGDAGPEVDHFEGAAARNISKLADELADGSFSPHPVVRVEIAKPSGCRPGPLPARSLTRTSPIALFAGSEGRAQSAPSWTGEMRYLIAYDIADDSRREDVATLLSGYGPRVPFWPPVGAQRTRRSAACGRNLAQKSLPGGLLAGRMAKRTPNTQVKSTT
jgi:hypothetical protein